MTDKALCLPFPLDQLRRPFLAQIVVPVNMTKDEAKRLCRFVESLAAPETELCQDGFGRDALRLRNWLEAHQ